LVRVIPSGGALAWLGDFRHAHYKAGANAVKKGFSKVIFISDFFKKFMELSLTLLEKVEVFLLL